MDKLDWNHARSFLEVCREGSLSAAARRLGQTQPTLGRQIATLEHGLGVVLFERIGNRLHLTDAGRELRSHAEAMAEAAGRFALSASGQSQTIEGIVRISTSDIYAAYLMPQIVEELREYAPKLRIELVATNDLSDLLRREADIALRHVEPSEPDLIARQICEAKADFYASTRYLQRMGEPKTLKDLAGHDFVGFGEDRELIEHFAGRNVVISGGQIKTGSRNGLVAWRLVQCGVGISVMAREVAQETPGVKRLFPELEPFPFPVWLVTHRELHTARRIRMVYDLLAARIPEMIA